MQQMVQENKSKFYVYVYLDPRKPGQYKYNQFQFQYQPFYVGKGRGGRKLCHLNRAYKFKEKNFHKGNKIRKIKNQTGRDAIIQLFKQNMLQKDSLQLQIQMIKRIGRHDFKLGPLTNATNGGDGTSGYKFSQQQNKNNSQRQMGEKNHNYGKQFDEQHCKKIALGVANHVRTTQHCANIKKARSYTSPQTRQKSRISHLGKPSPMKGVVKTQQQKDKIRNGFSEQVRKQAGQRSRRWHARTRDDRIKKNRIDRNEYLTKTFGLFIEQLDGRAFVKDVNTNQIVMSDEGYTCFASALKIIKRKYKRK